MPGPFDRFQILAAAVALTTGVASATAQSACMPPGPAARAHTAYYSVLASRTDTGSVRVRAGFRLLPAASAEVYLASDSTTCRAAARAFARERGDTSAVVPVYAIRVGPSRFIVFNYARHEPDEIGVVFDATFAVLALLTGF